MVLSNKKLKQKLRETLTESITTSVTTTKLKPTNQNQNSQPQNSLKQLVDSVTTKPRLSKREKRRKTVSFHGPNVVNREKQEEKEEEKMEVEVESGDDSEKKKKKKKKKRKKEEVEDEEEKFVKEPNRKKKKLKKKKKKKKVKSEGEKGENEEEGVVETDKNDESQVNEEVATKVYVGGIPYYSTEDDIQSYFEGCGTITEVDCMKFPDSGKFRGIAIISFKTEGAAKRALALDGSEMGELSLKIQPYKTTRANRSSDFAPKVVEGYNRIYVGNLSWDVTEDDLRKLFSDFNISSIRWGVDKQTEEFRGYAHVDFSDNLSLMMALKLDQEIVCGRPVKISCAVLKKGAKTYSKSVPSSEGADTGRLNSVPSSEGADTGRLNSVPTSEGAETSGLAAVSGKIRRRTCYECGEKGHLSSACPKKKTDDPLAPNMS